MSAAHALKQSRHFAGRVILYDVLDVPMSIPSSMEEVQIKPLFVPALNSFSASMRASLDSDP